MTEEKHNALTKEYNCLCLKVQSTCTAPAVGCVLKGLAKDGASIQLLSHYDQETKHKEKNFWALHGAILSGASLEQTARLLLIKVPANA